MKSRLCQELLLMKGKKGCSRRLVHHKLFLMPMIFIAVIQDIEFNKSFKPFKNKSKEIWPTMILYRWFNKKSIISNILNLKNGNHQSIFMVVWSILHNKDLQIRKKIIQQSLKKIIKTNSLKHLNKPKLKKTNNNKFILKWAVLTIYKQKRKFVNKFSWTIKVCLVMIILS